MPFPNPYFIDPNAYQQMQQMQQMAMQRYQNMQIPQQVTQSNVIIHVSSEEVARKWDVAPNCSVMFINDNEPYFYTKSAGASILETPIFKRFRITEEPDVPINNNDNNNVENNNNVNNQIDLSAYITKAEFESYKNIINDMQKIVKEFNGNNE